MSDEAKSIHAFIIQADIYQSQLCSLKGQVEEVGTLSRLSAITFPFHNIHAVEGAFSYDDYK